MCGYETSRAGNPIKDLNLPSAKDLEGSRGDI